MTTPAITSVEVSEPVITKAERSVIASPIGWSTIFAAAVVAGGVWLLLHMFGIGVGLTSIEPDDPGSLRSVGIGAGIWSLIAPVIALFIGGLVAGRIAPTINTLNAAIHGTVVWGLTALVSCLLIAMTLGAMARGISQATATVAGAAPISQLGQLPGALGLTAKDMLAPVNERLQARGMPEVQPAELEAIVNDVADHVVRQGGIDRETIVDITARRTALDRAEAEQVAAEIESEVTAATERGRGIAQTAGRKGLQAAEMTGKFVLTLSFTMLLALGAAILGSILSVRRERREHVVLPRATTRVAP